MAASRAIEMFREAVKRVAPTASGYISGKNTLNRLNRKSKKQSSPPIKKLLQGTSSTAKASRGRGMTREQAIAAQTSGLAARGIK